MTLPFSTIDNTAPVAVNDAYDVNYGQILTVTALLGVLANDTDADNDSLIALLLSDAGLAGSLTLSTEGSIVYTAPTTGALVSTDQFTYNASDGIDLSNSATVTITLTP